MSADQIVEIAVSASPVADHITEIAVFVGTDGVNDIITEILVAVLAPVSVSYTIDAGPDQRVEPNVAVTLPLSSTGGTPGIWLFEQMSGTPVLLSGSDTDEPSFTSPYLKATETLVFQASGRDEGSDPVTDTVSVTVNGHTRWRGDQPRILHLTS